MNNFEVVKLACKTVPVTEVDEFSKHILRVFEATKTSFELIESLIKYEIAENCIFYLFIYLFNVINFLCRVLILYYLLITL